MRHIQLHGKLSKNKKAIVSDEDFHLLARHRWNCDTDGYAISVGNRYKMHRLIIGAKPGQIVDHINGDRLDNRRENLRLVTPAQNTYNSKHNPGVSKYRGVNRANSKSERWEACISHNNKQLYLGTYATPEDAAAAYNRKAIELRGRYAVLNNI